MAYANVLQPKLLDRSFAPHAHALTVISAAGVVTYAFNPILLQPALAYLLWTSFGMLVGFALRAGAADAAPPRIGGRAARIIKDGASATR